MRDPGRNSCFRAGSISLAPAFACRRCRASPTARPRAAPRRSACSHRSQSPYVPSSMRASAASISARTWVEFSLSVLAISRSNVAVAMSPRWLSWKVGSSVSSPSEPGFSVWMFSIASSDALPLVEQALPEPLGVDRAHASPSFRAEMVGGSSAPGPSDQSRRRGWLFQPRSASPSRGRELDDLVPGRVSGDDRADLRGTPSASARSRTTASFARPRSGAALTRTFQPSPCLPTSSVRVAPGETRRRRRVIGSATSRQV